MEDSGYKLIALRNLERHEETIKTASQFYDKDLSGAELFKRSMEDMIIYRKKYDQTSRELAELKRKHGQLKELVRLVLEADNQYKYCIDKLGKF